MLLPVILVEECLECSLICSDKALICSTRVVSTVSKARVMWGLGSG